jgi:hypothetical protein
MRRRRNKSKIWIVLGGIVFIVVIIIGVRAIFLSKPLTFVAQNVAATSTAAASPTISTSSTQMYTQGSTVVARGRSYEMSAVSGLTTPGFFAVAGNITQIIPNPTTRSQTPYYFVIQDNNSAAIVGIIVPVGDETYFKANTFSIGAKVLVAGTVFPAINPATEVFDYSELLKDLHVAPGLLQLNLPPSTPYIGANFKDVKLAS